MNFKKKAEAPFEQPMPKKNRTFLRRKEQRVKRNIWDMRRLRHGSYSVVLTTIVLVAVVVLNLVVEEIPGQFTQFDFSEKQLSTIGDQTKEVLNRLTEDITLYYIVQDGMEDTYVSRLLERYEDASSHITVETKDPVLNPKFTSQYTDESLTDNSIIAVCGDVSRIIYYEDMYEAEFNYNYFSYETTGFDAEGQITSVIAALQSDDLPMVYTMTGHGETDLNDSLLQSMEKENLQTESLNLVTADAVPEDADCALLISPTSDISQEEAQKLLTYLQEGGRVIIFKDYSEEPFENLDSVLEYYGTTIDEGVVLEGNSNYYVQVPYYVVPDINSTEVSSDMTEGSAYVLLAAAQPIETLEDARETVSISSILSTSDSAYAKTDVANMATYEKESGDSDGPFDLGVLITEDVEVTDEEAAETDTEEVTDAVEEETTAAEEAEEADKEKAANAEEDAEGVEDTGDVNTGDAAETEGNSVRSDQTRLAVFSSSALLDASGDQMVSGGNSKLFMNTLSWICGRETSVSVPVKSLSVEYLTLTSASSSFWSIVTIALIPGAFLICGLYVWLRRRKQ